MVETANTYAVPEHHAMMYTANVQASLVREGGILRPYVSQAAYQGDLAQVVLFIGPIFFQKRTTVNEPTKPTEPTHKQRWITGDNYDCAVLVDRINEMKMIYSPTSPYVERMREAAARVEDDVIMSAFFGVARTGKQGTINVTFPVGDVIAHGGTRLTVAKLRALRKTFKKRFVDLRRMQPMLGVTSEQIDDLLGEVAVASADYNAVQPLVNGEVTRFMGIEFVPIEQIIPERTDAGPVHVRELPAWVRDGMHYGTWQGVVIRIGPRADLNNITQIHGCMSNGATRLEEGKVIKVEVVE